MTGFQGISPEHLARLFLHYREALAPDFPSAPATRCGEGSSWETVHDNERSLLVATAHMVLLELACIAHRNQHGDDGSGDKNQAGTGRVEGTEGKECGC